MCLETLFSLIDTYTPQVIRLQSELTARVALGPQNGGTGEHAKAAYVHSLFETLKPERIEEYRSPDPSAAGGFRPNVVARWPGRTAGPATWVVTHTDIVPPGDGALWHSDPYCVVVRDGQVIGRGVEDNQHGFVSAYLALQAVLATGRRPLRPVVLAAVADEETGSIHGLQYLLQAHAGIFDPADLMIVPDGGDPHGVCLEVAEKTMLTVKFVVQGVQCHASTPAKGRNSLYACARLIVALKDLTARFPLADPLYDPPGSTFEATRIEANLPNTNTIPGRDIFYLDCRILPHYSLEAVMDAIRIMVQAVEAEMDVTIEVDASHAQAAAPPTPVTAPVVRALGRAIERVKGRPAQPVGIGGGTVAAFFRRAGIPAVVWSTGFETPHQPNESCSIANILTDAKVLATLYLDAA